MSNSHSEQRIGKKDAASTEAIILADAFSDFISASARLEHFYSDLQSQVTQLGRELAERNIELNTKLAEQEQTSRSLQALMAALPCGVAVVERDGLISMINPEGKRLLNIVETSGCTIDTVYRSTGIDLALFLAMQSLEEGAASFHEEQELFSADTNKWLAVCGSRIRSDNTTEPRNTTVLTVRDITRSKQIAVEQELKYTKAAVSEAAIALAKEIRTPLTSLELFADLVAEEAGAHSPNAARWIAHLRAGIRSLADNADNVLLLHGVEPSGNRDFPRAQDASRTTGSVHRRPVVTHADGQIQVARRNRMENLTGGMSNNVRTID